MITVYTREGCVYCPQVIKYLTQKGVPHRVQEAEGDKYTTLSKIYGYSVPLVFNDETEQGMTGYSIPKLMNIIRNQQQI